MGAVLHDVRLGRAPHTVDHLVVAPTGIWLIDSHGTLRQAHHAITAMQLGVEIQTAVCLIDTTRPMSAGPFKIHHHWVTWPLALTDKIRSSGLVTVRAAHDIAHTIAELQTDAGRSPVAVDDASFRTGNTP